MEDIDAAGSFELDSIGAKLGMTRDKWEGDTSYRRRLKNSGMHVATPNMALRDYFAAKAMQGFSASPSMIDNNAPKSIAYVAAASYAMADAMLAERAK